MILDELPEPAMVRNLDSQQKGNDDIRAVGSVVRNSNSPIPFGNSIHQKLQRFQKKPKMGQNYQNKPKMGENHQNSKPKVGEKCRHCHFFMEFNTTIDDHFCRKAAQYVGPNQHCNICDMDFESTPKTFRHIMKDHFDVALGCEDGSDRWVF